MEEGERNENLQDEWSLMEESILINMIHIHNQLFGSSDLVLTVSSPESVLKYINRMSEMTF